MTRTGSATPRRRRCAPTSSASRPRSARGGPDAKGAHGLAIFTATALDLFEVLKLPEPVEHDPVIADTPFIEPLSAIGIPERWCAILVNRRVARLFSGPGAALEEIEHIEDDVRGRHDQGGWSQPNYQRSIDKDADDHLRRAAHVAFEQLKDDLPAGLLVGAPPRWPAPSSPTCTRTCAIASPGGWTSTSSTRAPTT